MRRYWHDIAARYDKLKTREQALVAGMGVLLLWFVFDALLLTPAAARQKSAMLEISQKRQEIQTLSSQLAALEATSARDPEAIARRRLEELQARLTAMQGDIREQSDLLIAAEKMPKVLERLLVNHPRVELVELKALPRMVLDLGANPKKADGAEQGARSSGSPSGSKAPDAIPQGIYRYGLEISIRGGYLDLLAYLRAIEAHPERFFWERVELTAVEYPVTTLKLKLYTMSLDAQWMRV